MQTLFYFFIILFIIYEAAILGNFRKYMKFSRTELKEIPEDNKLAHSIAVLVDCGCKLTYLIISVIGLKTVHSTQFGILLVMGLLATIILNGKKKKWHYYYMFMDGVLSILILSYIIFKQYFICAS